MVKFNITEILANSIKRLFSFLAGEYVGIYLFRGGIVGMARNLSFFKKAFVNILKGFGNQMLIYQG